MVHSSDRKDYLANMGMPRDTPAPPAPTLIPPPAASASASAGNEPSLSRASSQSLEIVRSQSSEWRGLGPLCGSEACIGDFTLGVEIGKGSFGAVVKAETLKNNGGEGESAVAIKILSKVTPLYPGTSGLTQRNFNGILMAFQRHFNGILTPF